MLRHTWAPEGRYLKDHSLIEFGGRLHMFSIVGSVGSSWMAPGSEEQILHVSTHDLVTWRQHPDALAASGVPDSFDEHMVVAPFVTPGPGGLHFMFYSAWRHPRREPDFSMEGNRQSIGVATSRDLDVWDVPLHARGGLLWADGTSVLGRDPHVVQESADRWLLYFTDPSLPVVRVASSSNMIDWIDEGIAVTLADASVPFSLTESPVVTRNPGTNEWVLVLNSHWAASVNPLRFGPPRALPFEAGIRFDHVDPNDLSSVEYRGVGLGFARELFTFRGTLFTSGVVGPDGHFIVGFHPVRWERDLFSLREATTS